VKKIALSCRVIKNETYYELREALDINWGAFMSAAGFLPVILPLRCDFSQYQFDGILLTGGNDLYAVSGAEIDKLRDDFEKRLIDYCIGRGIPVFGVCRGMQIINDYFGGSLKKITRHAGTTHKLDTGRTVNSYHGWAVDRVGEGLVISAKSGDGAAEELVSRRHAIAAQMHHPEREQPFSCIDIKHIQQFFGGTL
jgi:putative glutamine amidotransferase